MQDTCERNHYSINLSSNQRYTSNELVRC